MYLISQRIDCRMIRQPLLEGSSLERPSRLSEQKYGVLHYLQCDGTSEVIRYLRLRPLLAGATISHQRLRVRDAFSFCVDYVT
mmetsp:Transcript_8549/g.26759  ORF Transcript_8549/g.26759 Transcript_8549/m.26759 type:complete len:83 (-) Transcript_8549:794-1042(-)